MEPSRKSPFLNIHVTISLNIDGMSSPISEMDCRILDAFVQLSYDNNVPVNECMALSLHEPEIQEINWLFQNIRKHKILYTLTLIFFLKTRFVLSLCLRREFCIAKLGDGLSRLSLVYYNR